MEFKHKMRLFLNDPSFKRSNQYIKTYKGRIDYSKSEQPKNITHRNVFPTNLEIQRFKHLQQARINTIEDMHLSKNVEHSIFKLQQALITYHQRDKQQNLCMNIKTVNLKIIIFRKTEDGLCRRANASKSLLALKTCNQTLENNIVDQIGKKLDSKIFKNDRDKKSFKNTKLTIKKLKLKVKIIRKQNRQLHRSNKKVSINLILILFYVKFVIRIQICPYFYNFTFQRSRLKYKNQINYQDDQLKQIYKKQQMFSRIINIHKNFISKPNPYVTQEEAEQAYTKFTVGQFMVISAVGCFSLSLFKFVPKISQTSFFKKFTVFQAFTGIVAYGWYFYEINKIGNTIPNEQLQLQKQNSKKKVSV